MPRMATFKPASGGGTALSISLTARSRQAFTFSALFGKVQMRSGRVSTRVQHQAALICTHPDSPTPRLLDGLYSCIKSILANVRVAASSAQACTKGDLRLRPLSL